MKSIKKNNIGSVRFSTIFCIICFLGLCLILPQPAQAHLSESEGESGQMYSYYLEGSDRPVIDGFFDSSGGGGNSEWAQAYVRMIKLVNQNGSKETDLTLFLMNDAEYLFIGISYLYENSGNSNNFVELLFDEGDGGSKYDGEHDDMLTGTNITPNENGVMCKKGTTTILEDYCWNGTAWIIDGDASTDFEAEVEGDSVSTQLKYEFKIPINSKSDNSSASDLNIGPADELGFFIHARLQGQTSAYTDYYWSMTNGNVSDAGAWGDLRLGVKLSDLIFYSTYAINGVPNVDGDISGDFSWADSYERDLIFTNFNGSKLNMKLYLTEDPVNSFVYIGVVVYDSKSSPDDCIMVHFEQNYTSLPSMERDFLMDANKENLLMVSKGDGFSDRKFTASGGISYWIEDSVDPTNENQTGAVNYYLSPNRYEFEIKLNYSAASDGFNTEDLYLNNNALFGMQIQYHDGDTTEFPNFWWEYNGNTNATLIDKNSNTFLAMGYSYLQLGGPAIKLISPQNGGIVSGSSYDFKIIAVDENSNGVTWCGFQVEGEISWISLIKDTSSDIWSTDWDTTALNNGLKTITIVAKDDDNIVVRRYLQVQVSNIGSGTPPSLLSFNLETSEPEPLSGISVEFTAEALGPDGIKFYVDGEWLGDMTEVGSGTYEYSLDSTQLNDGKHVFRAIAFNTHGERSLSKTYTVDNWNLVSNPIDNPGTAVSGTYGFIVRPNPADDTEYTELYIDNSLYGRDDSISVGMHQFSIDTKIFKDGLHFAKAISYDPDGNFIMSFLTFEIDNWHPAISINAPLDNAVVSGTISVKVSGTDLVSVSLYVDDSLISSDVSAGPWDFSLDTTKFNDGSHRIKTIGLDQDSTSVMDSILLTFQNDANGPECAIVNPVIDQVIYEDLIVRVYAFDTSGVKTVKLFIDDGTAIYMSNEVGSSYYIYYLSILSLEPGNHTLKATAYDINDNSGSSLKIKFFNGLIDSDSDSILDIVDSDMDGDGVDNIDDEFPNDPQEWLDSDNDGIGNNADNDDDNDGWSDNKEIQYNSDPLNPANYPSDLDSDGIPDSGDSDIDGDGISNSEDSFPRNPDEWSDMDNDGEGDNSDLDIDGDQIINTADPFPYDNSEWLDLDNDGIGDNSDNDIDGDGVSNSNDTFPRDNEEWSDLDNDGIGDNSDQDIDGDGVPNIDDAFKYDPDETRDLDNDGIGDNSDDDIDGDGILNSDDDFPKNKNEWSDLDNDGIGDNSDNDIDGDGIEISDDAFPFNKDEWSDHDLDGTGDNSDSDLDNDGIDNDLDAFPKNENEWSDTDDDGLGDNSDNDIDGDGALNINDDLPFDGTEIVDTDGDGVGNKKDKDDDNDGVPDSEDLAPLNPRIGRADYTWLALPMVIVILYIFTLIVLILKKKKGNIKDNKPSEKDPQDLIKSEKIRKI